MSETCYNEIKGICQQPMQGKNIPDLKQAQRDFLTGRIPGIKLESATKATGGTPCYFVVR